MCLVKCASMLDSLIGLLSVSQWLVLVELVSGGQGSMFCLLVAVYLKKLLITFMYPNSPFSSRLTALHIVLLLLFLVFS